ncbi:MAG: c-type cytochrome [Pseudomonadales bacterium]
MTTVRSGVLIFAIATAAALASQGLRFIPESSPVERGAAAANSHGCIECHGQADISFPDDAELTCANVDADSSHPRYGGRCSDILAYFEVIRLKRTFNTRVKSASKNRLLQGEVLARQYNCFQCHGELGQGGFRNAGALKGYIPGYFGKDFELLTQGGNTESVRTWITQGIDPALFANPIEGTIAEYFIERQAVSMPVFKSLPDSSIRILADYVITLNQFGAMDAEAIRAYGRQTQQL